MKNETDTRKDRDERGDRGGGERDRGERRNQCVMRKEWRCRRGTEVE